MLEVLEQVERDGERDEEEGARRSGVRVVAIVVDGSWVRPFL